MMDQIRKIKNKSQINNKSQILMIISLKLKKLKKNINNNLNNLKLAQITN